MATPRIRVGLIGANPGYGWGSRAHVPAIRALPELELVAVCTSKSETAEAAAQQFGVAKAYSDYHEMVRDEDIDLVNIAVRVPLHYPMAMAALQAGKHVFCEWPLALNSEQATDLASLARARNLRHGVDVQARGAPAIMRFRELVQEGYLGQPLTFNMSMFLPGALLPRRTRPTWGIRKEDGGTALTIAGGHAIDILGWCLGEIEALCADVRTLVPRIRVTETGEEIETTSADTVSFVARLRSGAVGVTHISNAARPGRGWRLEVYGSQGSLMVTTPGMIEMSPAHLVGAQGGEREMKDIPIPPRLTLVSGQDPESMGFQVAQLLRPLAQAIRDGRDIEPNFDDATRLHRLLEAIQASSDRREWISLA